MDVIDTIALSMGAAWASGINLYAAVFVLGYLHLTGNIMLPPEMQVLADPLVLAAAGVMYVIEFFADKVPGVDNGWDTLHTFIRIPAGAVLAAQAVGEVGPAAELAAIIIGGSLAAGSHFTKAGSRVLINTSPEPFTNWGASLGEDLLVIAGLWTALNYPLIFIVLLVLFVALTVWLLPKIWRALRAIAARIRSLFRRISPDEGEALPPPAQVSGERPDNGRERLTGPP